MLTAELVHARRKKGELTLLPLSDDGRRRALELATQLHGVALAHVGRTREELEEAWAALRVSAKEQKLSDGLKKLVDDGLELAVDVPVEPIALRREVFELAAARRRALGEAETFDREGLLTEVAARHELTPERLEGGLFGDLKSAHVLRAVTGPAPEALVRGYDLEQARAVLLRAVRVVARIEGAGPAALRGLFRALKFHRLLHTLHREPDGAFRVEIDGPFSLFEGVTKYGLALALALPHLMACGRWQLAADVRWGKRRDALVFRLAGDAAVGGAHASRLPDEVEALRERFTQRGGPWRVRAADDVIELPGVGLAVPDLAFEHTETGEVILLEVMGYWSREAVWKRIELVEAGLSTKIVFAVSERLRVSEAVLGPERPACLYVYKGTMSAKQLEDRLDALAAR